MRPLSPLLFALLGCNAVAGLDGLSFSGAGGAGVGGAGAAEPSGGADAGGAGAVVFTDDGYEGELAEGTFDGVAWNADHIELVPPNTAGTFTSRVFDAGAEVSWHSAALLGGARYGVPLPDQATGDGEIDMTGNVLLLHFDEAVPLTNGAVVADASGRGNDMVLAVGSKPPTYMPGPLGSAVSFDADSYLSRALGPGSDFDFGTDDATWAAWVRIEPGHPCASNEAAIGVEDGTATGPHMWLGCRDINSSNCAGPSGQVHAGGTWRAVDGAPDGGLLCGQTEINDGAWHLISIVREGEPTGVLLLYVDGVLEQSLSVEWHAPIAFAATTSLYVGSFSPTEPATMQVDEVAMWRRALSAAEQQALYVRGALRLELQVRTCSDPSCNNTTFLGPAADPSAHFLPISATLDPQPLGAPFVGRYAQYRVSFTTPRPGLSPELFAVSMRGGPLAP